MEKDIVFKSNRTIVEMSKKQQDDFYKNNKSYCPMAFKEVYADNNGRYRLCCHATVEPTTEKYKTQNTAPFEYFLSKEMEAIRNKMMAGQKIEACKTCYDLEDKGHQSYRNGKYKQKYGIDITPRNVGLKLRIHGSYCNLGCYMCFPYNSSTRRNELTEVFGSPKEASTDFAQTYDPVKYKEWEKIMVDVEKHAHLISYMNFTGGEPLQLPNHWKMIDRIPEEHAKHIELHYDTNLTDLRWKNHSIFDVNDKFKKVDLGVSCDHFGEKLDWIRYPIDRKQFEANLEEANHIVKQLNCTVSLLNVYDLHEIYDYYYDKYGIKTTFHNVVRGPRFLSIKNLPEKNKLEIKRLYKGSIAVNTNYINAELDCEPHGDLDEFRNYCDKLSANRNFDWRKIWHDIQF